MQDIIDNFTGQNLKTRREEKLLTQEELAEELGVSKLTVLKWENKKAVPSMKHLRTLKDFFETHKEVE